jgi:hypothetical protein
MVVEKRVEGASTLLFSMQLASKAHHLCGRAFHALVGLISLTHCFP